MTDNIEQRDEKLLREVDHLLAFAELHGYTVDTSINLDTLRAIAAALREQHLVHEEDEPVSKRDIAIWLHDHLSKLAPREYGKLPTLRDDLIVIVHGMVDLYTRPQPASEPEYDRALIASMLDDAVADGTYTAEVIWGQQRLLREADNRGSARTVDRSATSDDRPADTQRAIIEAAEQRGYARAKAEGDADKRDAERLRQFTRWADEGLCPALVFDDNGHWAVSFDGAGEMFTGDDPPQKGTVREALVEPGKWRDTPAEAIDAAIAAQRKGGE